MTTSVSQVFTIRVKRLPSAQTSLLLNTVCLLESHNATHHKLHAGLEQSWLMKWGLARLFKSLLYYGHCCAKVLR